MEDLTPKLRNIIANTSMFKMLNDHQLNVVASHTRPVRASNNTYIVNQGDPGEGMFWVVYGQVKVGLYSEHGSEKAFAILGPGKCFGLGEMVLGQPHAAFVKTTADCLLLHISRDAILMLAEENVGFAREVMRCLGRQFYALMLDIEASSQTARQRLAAYLLRQVGCDQGNEIELVAKKVLVASRLSLAPQTLSRLFREFAAEGLIKVAGRRITILDWNGMTSLVA